MASQSRVQSGVQAYTEFPYPTEYAAPQIPNIVGFGTNYVVTPAHPTSFKWRKLGTMLETTATPNADGSVTLDINSSNTAFAGFINYGSAVFGSGAQGIIPVSGPINDPSFFGPIINTGPVLMPIFDSTKISTQIVVRPTVTSDIVTVDMIPQLKVITSVEPGLEGKVISLKQYRTSMLIKNGKVGMVNGFEGASPEFNRRFLGGKEKGEAPTSIKIRARVRPGEVKSEEAEEAEEKKIVEKGDSAVISPPTGSDD